MKPLLIVDCYLDDAPGAPYYARWFSRPTVSYRPPLGEGPPPLDSACGVLVTGSKACLSEPEPWMAEVIQVVRDAVDRDMPVLGCCFGHQLLAVAAAGDEVVHQTEQPEVGYLPIDKLAPDPVLDILGDRFVAFVTHSDAVRPSPAFEVLARSAACPVHALRLPGKKAWGVQFHVEYPREEQERILRYRAEKHPELGLDPDRMLEVAPDTSDHARRLFSSFERQC